MSVRCARLRPGLRGQARPGRPVRRPEPRAAGRFLRMLAEVPRFHRAARRLLAAGAPGDLTFGEFLRRGGYSGYFQAHFALPLVAAVWSCPAGTALEYPGRVPVRLPGQPRDAVGVRLAALAHRDRRFPVLRRAGRAAAGLTSGSAPRSARCAATRTAPRYGTRPGQAHRFDAVVIATHPGPGAAAARAGRPGPSGRCSARSATPRTRPCCTPTPGCCRAAAVSAPRGTTSSATARPATGRARGQLPHEPAAGPARRPRLHRDAERGGRRRPSAG